MVFSGAYMSSFCNLRGVLGDIICAFKKFHRNLKGCLHRIHKLSETWIHMEHSINMIIMVFIVYFFSHLTQCSEHTRQKSKRDLRNLLGESECTKSRYSAFWNYVPWIKNELTTKTEIYYSVTLFKRSLTDKTCWPYKTDFGISHKNVLSFLLKLSENPLICRTCKLPFCLGLSAFSEITWLILMSLCSNNEIAAPCLDLD